LIGGYAENRDAAARWAQQAGHQIHQGRLAGTIGAHETGNACANTQVDAIHSKYLTVKFGDIIEDYLFRHIIHRSISSIANCRFPIANFVWRYLFSPKLTSM
jgi:hypothetical protein